MRGHLLNNSKNMDKIIHIALPDGMPTVSRRLSFYLAMEDYVAQKLSEQGKPEECFFLWRVAPTVIIGRNQVLENEVNLPYCRQHGIDIVRRKSGGGAVYADRDNVMFSFICRRTHQPTPEVFAHYLDLTVELLRSLGVEACTTDHNDVLIGTRKVSGWAVHQMQDSIIVHGTMLYDTCMDHMLASITPPTEKLARKGVESVRQRICLLKDFIGNRMTVDEFADYAVSHLCEGRKIVLTDDDMRRIEELSGEYKI